MAHKFTDWVPTHDVQRFKVINAPTGGHNKVGVLVGSGGKGSKYEYLEPEDALQLAHYLIFEAVKAQSGKPAKDSKEK